MGILAAALCVLSGGWGGGVGFSAQPSPVVGPSAGPALFTPALAKQLLKEFNKAQRSEADAFDHRQDLEFKALSSSQRAAFKEWMYKEADSRHKFFADHPEGHDRRDYVEAFKVRRDALLKSNSDNLVRRKKENKDRAKALKDAQAVQLRAFQEALGRGVRPPAELWPQGH